MASRRYLFGPVPAAFAEQNLYRVRERGECLAFGYSGAIDLVVGASESWASVRARFPTGWEPDFVVLNLPYTSIPPALWSAPLPRVGLATDWNLLWHGYRHCVTRCDLVLTDTAGVEAFRRLGMEHVRAANLFGCERAFMEQPPHEGPRDIDVLFVGNLHPAVQRERLPWLARLASLGKRWKVVIRTGVFGEEYRQLMRRARIVFNRSIRGECNMRAFEAAVAGALLFQERENLETPAIFRDRQECIYYTADDLESLLRHYLEHEDQRQALARAGQECAQHGSFADLWDQHLGLIDQSWDVLWERSQARPTLPAADLLLARTWAAFSATNGPDPLLVTDLAQALAAEPESAQVHNVLGVAVALAARGTGPITGQAAVPAIEHFQRAVECASGHVPAALNLVEAFTAVGRTREAVDRAQQALATLDRGPLAAEVLDSGRFPPVFDHFQVEWERAAWSNAGQLEAEAQAKHALLRWRLHLVLADLTGDVEHYRQAVAVRPDLPPSQAALGCALGRAGRYAEALAPLQAAVAGNPFDRQAAQALFETMRQLGDRDGKQRLAEARRLLSRACPQAVPAESWFAERPTSAASPGKQTTRIRTISPDDFHKHFGNPDTRRAIHVFTNPVDTHAVLTLLAHARPRRILEIGTAMGHMTANLTEWSSEEATVFSLGTIEGLAAGAVGPQAYENPPPGQFGRVAGHFGKLHKACFILADSLSYDFGRLGPLDFAFIDGAHDLLHVLSDSQKVYRELRPGGWLVWHDFGSVTPWVQVQQAVAGAGFSEPVYHVAGTEVAFLQKQGDALEADRTESEKRGMLVHRVAPAPAAELSLSSSGNNSTPDLGIVWEGPIASMQSLALVNREFCRRLMERCHALSIQPVEPHPAVGVPVLPTPGLLEASVNRPLPRIPDVHVRHAWPPNFTPPAAGRWVVMQPWEYGSLPRAWVEPLVRWVDEVWAYSRHVRDCYIRSGVPEELVHIVPLGVDGNQFHPSVPALPLKTRKRFKFLFVGGTVYRKGIDVLLAAYGQAFTATDDVCLVIKDMGVGSFYRGQTAEARITACQAQPGAPEIEYHPEPLSAEELAGLYTACNCLVHPYRGEGFGLPIAEAMASGLPVIVTGLGAALDFCQESHAYLIPAREKQFSEKRVGDLETVDFPWLAEPDPEVLQVLLRRVYENPREAKAKGQAARAHIAADFTWEHAAAVLEQRLTALMGKPIRRFGSISAPPSAPLAEQAVSTRPDCLPGQEPEPSPSHIVVRDRCKVSLSMIVKNEEATLPACLESAHDLVDEIVIADTGSTDRTKEVAARYGAKVIDFPWVDSFAAARNASLAQVAGDWVLWLDADDRLDEENRQKLRRLLAGLRREMAGYAMKCLCLPDPETGTATCVDHLRLFPRHRDISWEFRVHEQVLPSLKRQQARIYFADIVIQHTGYLDAATRARKRERDLRLLQLAYQDDPTHPFTLFNLGYLYQDMNQPAQALEYCRRSLEGSQPEHSIVRKLYAMMAACQRQLGQAAEAVATCQAGRRYYADDVELLFQEGLARRDAKDLNGAIACFRQALVSRDGAHFGSVVVGLQGYKTRHNIGVVLVEQGRLAEAEAEYRAALAEQPGYVPAWTALGDLYIRQQRWADMERVAATLDQTRADVEAALVRARGAMARQDHATARRVLEAALPQKPAEQRLWICLSHTLLQAGRDWSAAEHALQRILELNPNHGEARQNLAQLQRQRGREPGADKTQA